MPTSGRSPGWPQPSRPRRRRGRATPGTDVPALTTLSYTVNYALGGLDPFGFHLANVLLHATVCILVLLLGLRLGLPLPAASVAAALFAVMPVHVEAVANVAGRRTCSSRPSPSERSSAHPRAMRRGGLPRARSAARGGRAALEGGGAGLVGLLAAHDLLFARAEWKSHRRRALGLFSSYLRRHPALRRRPPRGPGNAGLPPHPLRREPGRRCPALVRMMTATAVLGRGLLLLVLPTRLSADYSYAAILPVTSPRDPAFLASATAILALAAAAWRFRKSFPLGPFAFLWYGISIFPASTWPCPSEPSSGSGSSTSRASPSRSWPGRERAGSSPPGPAASRWRPWRSCSASTGSRPGASPGHGRTT